MRAESVWTWEQPDPSRANTSGDVGKLFKNQPIKAPGVFSIAAPASDASLLAREVIQNAWDSAREHRRRLGDPELEFQINFDFQSHEGPAREQLVEALGLEELRDRASEGVDRRRRMGLRDRDLLNHLESAEPLRTLVISEAGTTGLEGPWREAQSKMFLAMLSVGFTQKGNGSGGSYGYGKAALIRGSAIRTVLAYSSFAQRPDDGSVTRRLLGITYWGQHEFDRDQFTGFGRLGEITETQDVVPLTNEAADRKAVELGLEKRTEDEPGTVFMLVDPTIEPADLLKAIEQNWWPALVSRELQFTATVSDYDNVEHIPRPRRDPILKPFIRALDIATGPQDTLPAHEKTAVFTRRTGGLKTGRLGLVSELDGWSYADQMEALDPQIPKTEDGHRSLVALVRGPRMVVEYLPAGTAPPYLRGTFVADDGVEDLLRQTEPQAHDEWQIRPDGGANNLEATAIARSIIERIKRLVRDTSKELRPPPPPPDDVRLTVLDDLVKDVLRSGGRSHAADARTKADISITVIDQVLKPIHPGGLRFEAKIRLVLADHIADDERAIKAMLFFRFLEDGRGGQLCPLENLQLPPGFTMDDDGGIVGSLGHEAVILDISTEAYSDDWTGRLTVRADFTRRSGATNAN